MMKWITEESQSDHQTLMAISQKLAFNAIHLWLHLWLLVPQHSKQLKNHCQCDTVMANESSGVPLAVNCLFICLFCCEIRKGIADNYPHKLGPNHRKHLTA